jgi:hypothetical protein
VKPVIESYSTNLNEQICPPFIMNDHSLPDTGISADPTAEITATTVVVVFLQFQAGGCM